MNEIFLLLLGFLGVFAAGGSIALLALGKMIDRFPAGDESARTRSIASPIETTKLSVALFWAFFVVGGWAMLQENRIVMIAGITILFAITLFMFTALIFSFAVLNTMREEERDRNTGRFAGAPDNSRCSLACCRTQAEPSPAPVIRKRYQRFRAEIPCQKRRHLDGADL